MRNSNKVLCALINELSKNICLTSQTKEKLINNIKNMIYEDAIDYIIRFIYISKNNGLISEKDFIVILNLFLNHNIYNSLQEIINRIDWLNKMKLFDNEIQLKKSHIEILDTFDRVNILLNSISADYYHTSGILTYLLTNNELRRYHHDLDIFINENDLDRLRNVCNYSTFEFREYLGAKGEDEKRRTIKIYDKKNNIIISVFVFERLCDGSVVINDYYFDSNENLKMDQDYNSRKCVELSFSNVPKMHNGIEYFSITIEALYNCKKGRSYKHQYDCEVIKDFIDFSLEQQIDLEKSSIRHFEFIDNQKIINDMERMLNIEKNEGKQKTITKK